MYKKDFLTVAELAAREGITRQRAHQLIRTYGVQTEKLCDRFLIIPKTELHKIPSAKVRERFNGVGLHNR